MERPAELEESRLTTESSAGALYRAAPNPIDEFLDFHNTDHDLHVAVREQLGQVVSPGWLADLCALNIDEPDVDFISNFLGNYRHARPWVISDARIEEMRKLVAEDTASSHRRTPIETDPAADSIIGAPLPQETLEDFLARLEDFCETLSKQHIVFNGYSLDDEASRVSYTSPQHVDTLLGIAGFRPDESLKGQSTSREDVVNEWQQHVGVRGCQMDVSLESKIYAHQPWDDERGTRCITQILLLYRRLRITLEQLRSTGQLDRELTFLRRTIPRTEGHRQLLHRTTERDVDSNQYCFVETRAVSMKQVEDLLMKIDEFMVKISGKEEPENTWWSWARAAASSALAGGLPVHLFYLPTLIAHFMTAFMTAFTRSWLVTSVRVRLDALSELTTAISPILKTLSLPEIPHGRQSGGMESEEEKLRETLREIALTGQVLCLLLQGNTRGFEAPYEFEGLIDRPISEFRLRGVDFERPAICAFSQRLPCFRDKEFLVFDATATDGYCTASELRTSPATAMRLLRPAQLFVRTQNSETSSRASCVGLGTGDGLILPCNTLHNPNQLNRWQWHSFDQINVPSCLGELDHDTVTAVGLHEEIRIDLIDLNRNSDTLESNTLDQPRIVESLTLRAAQTRDEAEGVVGHEIQQQCPETDPQRNTDNLGITEAPADSSANSREGRRGSNPDPAPTISEQSPTSCPWESKEAEFSRRKDLIDVSGDLIDASERWEFGVQAQAGIQPPFASIQGLVHFTRSRAKLYRKIVLNQGEPMLELQRSSCVLLSFHTGVLKRVRLREVVSYLIEKGFIAKGLNGAQQKELLTMLKSSADIVEWKGQKEHVHDGEKLVSALIDVTIETLQKLVGCTGVFRRRGLSLLWPGQPPLIPRLSRREDPWIEALKDTKITTTLACIVGNCQETPECKCKMKTCPANDRSNLRWELPATFRLHTSVCGYRNYINDRKEQLTLREGKAYWINDPKLGMLAEVIAVVETATEEGANETTFYLSLRSSTVPGWINQYFQSYPRVREVEPSAKSNNCVIGSGVIFEKSVRRYIDALRG